MRKSLADVIAEGVRRELEGRHYVSLRWIGEQIGLSHTQVGHRYHGRIEWRPSELDALARALGITVTRFVRVPPNRRAAHPPDVDRPKQTRRTDLDVRQT